MRINEFFIAALILQWLTCNPCFSSEQPSKSAKPSIILSTPGVLKYPMRDALEIYSRAYGLQLPLPKKLSRPIIGGIEVEFYNAMIKDTTGERLNYNHKLAVSDAIELKCEESEFKDGTGYIEAISKASIIDSLCQSKAMKDIDVLRLAQSELRKQNKTIPLSQFISELNKKLSNPLRPATKKDTNEVYDDYGIENVIISPSTIYSEVDEWHQQTIGGSLYVFSNPGLVHPLIYTDQPKDSIFVNTSNTHDSEYCLNPMAPRLATLHEISKRARQVVNQMVQNISNLPDNLQEKKSLKKARHYEKLIGWISMIGQNITFPGNDVPGVHPNRKDRVALLPHNTLKKVYDNALSENDRAFVQTWVDNCSDQRHNLISKYESLAHLISTAMGLDPEARIPDVPANVAEYIVHQIDPELEKTQKAKEMHLELTDWGHSIDLDSGDEYDKKPNKPSQKWTVIEVRTPLGDTSGKLESHKNRLTKEKDWYRFEEETISWSELQAISALLNPPPEIRRRVRNLNPVFSIKDTK